MNGASVVFGGEAPGSWGVEVDYKVIGFWSSSTSASKSGSCCSWPRCSPLLAAAALVRRVTGPPDPRWAAVLPAYAIGGIASYWVFERIAAFF